MDSNEKKALQLGMPLGTASAKLRKAILFKFLSELGHGFCFHCKEAILDVDNLSIEHKEPWMDSDNPIDRFFDLENIAFSHLSCNSGAGRRHKKYASVYERERAATLRKYADPITYEKHLARKRKNYVPLAQQDRAKVS